MSLKDVTEVDDSVEASHYTIDQELANLDSDGNNRNDVFEDIGQGNRHRGEKWLYNGYDDNNDIAQNEETTKKNDED